MVGRSRSHVVTDGQSVSQSISTSWYRAPLRDLRPDITRRSKLLYDWQSISTSWYRAPLWDLRPDIISCRNVAARTLRSRFCGAPSWREDGSTICSLITQWSESRRIRNHTLLSHMRLLQPGGPGSRIYIPQKQNTPVIPWALGFTSIQFVSYYGIPYIEDQSANNAVGMWEVKFWWCRL
jgi:hypothetical protein